ncbi:unnamed protein product [Sphagnum balticum]
MAKARKGVLVMDDSGRELLGILTPKDILSRVVSKELPAESIQVSSVMTPNPECVSADMTLIDALKEMHDQKFLHLPVKESDGRVLGVVDVMELVCSTAGGEGGKGWRDFFRGAMEVRDDASESELSERSASIRSKGSKRTVGKENVSQNKENKENDSRPVSKLRPKAPVLLTEGMTVMEVAETLASKRADAGIIVGDNKKINGIVTDNDITRRVVSLFVDPTKTLVSEVMTRSPKCVQDSDSALDALDLMVSNRFRHLPVLDESGSVVGLLDIAKCLHDAISALEKVHDKEGGDGGSVMAESMVTALKKVSGSRGTNKAQVAAMQAMMQAMFGGSIPTLRSILGVEHLVSLRASSNVREAAGVMAKARKGVLVMDDGELVGILTPKDILSRVVAQRKSPDLTAVSSVMTPNPECVSADMTLIDALKEMHDQKFLHLPVKESDGRVLGVVDVMELVCSTAGGEGGKGWRDFFRGAMEAGGDKEDHSETASDISASVRHHPKTPLKARVIFDGSSERPTSIGETDRFFDGFEFSFKVKDASGHTHRVRAPTDSLQHLKKAVATQLQCLPESLTLRYFDDEKDEIVLTTDQSLREAVEVAKTLGTTALKIDASVDVAGPTPAGEAKYEDTSSISPPTASAIKSSTMQTALIAGSTVAVVAIAAALVFVILKNRKS